jgi:hypothetical protein
LPVERDGGTVYVLIGAVADDRTTADRTRTTDDQPTDRTDLLIAELQHRVRSLEEANRENRRIIAALTQRIPELPPSPGSAAEGSSFPEPREAPVTATEQPGRVGAQPAVEGAQEPAEAPEMPADEQQGRGPVRDAEGPQGPAEPRSWWRRVFGGSRWDS